MLLNTAIKIRRTARDPLTTMIDLAESFRDSSDHSDPLKPPPTGGLTWSSIHGPVGPVRGFGSVYDQPHEPSGLR